MTLRNVMASRECCNSQLYMDGNVLNAATDGVQARLTSEYSIL